MVFNKKYICDFHSHFGHRAPKTLGISYEGSDQVSFVMLRKVVGKLLIRMVVARGTNHWLAGCNFQLLTSNHYYVMKSVKTQKDEDLERFWVVELVEEIQGGSMDTPSHFPMHCSMHLSHLAIPELYPIITNWWSRKQTDFLSFVSYSRT